MLSDHLVKSDGCGVHHRLSELLRRDRPMLVPLTGIKVDVLIEVLLWLVLHKQVADFDRRRILTLDLKLVQ